jgi:16S rRNA (guanine1207-N2)-methyltransferase
VVDRPPHYFSTTPPGTSRRRRVPLPLPDRTLELTTDSGVFSADRVDPGTRLLLQEAPAPPAGPRQLLDLGCGYGPLAVVMALRAPEATVWAVDVNERAVALCAENAAEHGATNVTTVVVDGEGNPVDPEVTLPPFDLIWSNPAIRIGKPALQRMLATWLGRLRPDGGAVLVVQRHLGADSLAAWLSGSGWATERLASRRGYRLLGVAARQEERS